MSRPRNLQDILANLPDAQQHGDSWTASCPLPGHNTPQGHLTVKDAGDKCLITCQGGRHRYNELCTWLGFESLAYSDGGGGNNVNGVECKPVNLPDNLPRNHSRKHDNTKVNTPVESGVKGVTLKALAGAKNLALTHLQSLGITDLSYNGQHAVRIPYYSEHGQELAVRLRLALQGKDRFRWRKGDHPFLYGLQRLEDIRKAGWVLLVEGESDCWVCWEHGIPALGVPGKSIWREDWGEYLDGLDVYLWQEPDAEDFTLRVLASVPGLRYIPAPQDTKDVADAHLRGTEVVPWLQALRYEALSGQDLRTRRLHEKGEELYTLARPIIEADDPLVLIRDAIRGLGYGGDIRTPVITYLAVTSRLLEMRSGAMPVHLLLTGPSSGGKSYTKDVVKRIMPDDACHEIDAGSPRVLIYDDSRLQHKALIFGEADSLPAGEDNPAASAIRNLLQDHQLHYEVTVRDRESGEYTVKKVRKPGPTVLITTSTRRLGDQLMTRFFTLEVGDSKEQIGAALETQAILETDHAQADCSTLIAFQDYLQLKAPVKAVVPFALQLSGSMKQMAAAPRILRDFARLMSLIKVVALLRHHHRQVDDLGRIVAQVEDYSTVRELVNDMYVESSTGATENIRQLVQAVADMEVASEDGKGITNTALANHLGIGIVQAQRRAKRAVKMGWLVNREQRRSYPADYALGEPMPSSEGLPDVDTLTGLTPVNTTYVNDSSFGNEGVYTLTPLTAGDTSSPPGGMVSTTGDGFDDPEPPMYPIGPCGNCGSKSYWLRGNEAWICSRCHPKPNCVNTTGGGT